MKKEITVREKMLEAVQKELLARDDILSGGAKLKARRAEIQKEIEIVRAKVETLKVERLDLTKAGTSTANVNEQLKLLNEKETVLREELESIPAASPVDEQKLRQANATLERAGFAVVKLYRGDAEAEKIAVSLFDFIEGRQVLYEDFLRKDLSLDINNLIDWRAELDPHLSNSIIKRMDAFGPYLQRSELLPERPAAEQKVKDEDIAPSLTQVERNGDAVTGPLTAEPKATEPMNGSGRDIQQPVKPKPLTPQEDARQKAILSKQQRPTVMETEYNSL